MHTYTRPTPTNSSELRFLWDRPVAEPGKLKERRFAMAFGEFGGQVYSYRQARDGGPDETLGDTHAQWPGVMIAVTHGLHTTRALQLAAFVKPLRPGPCAPHLLHVSQQSVKAQAPSWNVTNSLHTPCSITHSTCPGSPGMWPPEAVASVRISRRHKQII